MTDHHARHHRHSIRLKGYDYSQAGAYFITICTHKRHCLFGEIINGAMRLNEYGLIVHNEWQKSASIRAEISLGEFVIMPNHFHAIVCILDQPRRGVRPDAPTNEMFPAVIPMADVHTDDTSDGVPTTNHPSGPISKSIGSLMAGFKSSVTKQVNILRNTPAKPVWQRNFYEHIIRDENAFLKISEYIINNPYQWENDWYYVGNLQ